ncbi:hypothetical protein PAPYR_11256 [Paratrimastix pyriformis]|uniref:Uncharacterized protein n=1 Tax=Paratrimastix pyriformis TaxID=342808 RepID=A0ABQ8U831_9EUKA|nr:hypothetical protein PAPYR_11256 [Paratrimastix pyriformis]
MFTRSVAPETLGGDFRDRPWWGRSECTVKKTENPNAPKPTPSVPAGPQGRVRSTFWGSASPGLEPHVVPKVHGGGSGQPGGSRVRFFVRLTHRGGAGGLVGSGTLSGKPLPGSRDLIPTCALRRLRFAQRKQYELDRLEPVPHPQEAIEYCEGAIGQDPPKWAEGYQAINCFRRRLYSLTQPLGAGLVTPYHLELIQQTFDGLFRPSSPDSAAKDLLLDIGGEEDEPEREEPSSVFASHLRLGAKFVLCSERPLPTPTAPKAPTAPTAPTPARPTTPASGAVEHKDKGTGAARPILDDDDVPSPPKPKKAAPVAAKPKKDREAPEEGKKAAPVAAKSKKEAAKEAKAAAPAPPPPARRKPGPPHEAKEAAEAKGSDDAPARNHRFSFTSSENEGQPSWDSPKQTQTKKE